MFDNRVLSRVVRSKVKYTISCRRAEPSDPDCNPADDQDRPQKKNNLAVEFGGLKAGRLVSILLMFNTIIKR